MTDKTVEQEIREQISHQHRAALEPLMRVLKTNTQDFERLLKVMDDGMVKLLTASNRELLERLHGEIERRYEDSEDYDAGLTTVKLLVEAELKRLKGGE